MSMTYLVYPTFRCMQHGLTGNHNMQGFSGFGNGKIQHIFSSGSKPLEFLLGRLSFSTSRRHILAATYILSILYSPLSMTKELEWYFRYQCSPILHGHKRPGSWMSFSGYAQFRSIAV